jgi:hypothetical protein
MEDAFEAVWGPRCDEYEAGCPTCDAWRRFDTKSTEEQTIHVRVRNIYGNKTIYPVCDKAQIFAQMAGHSTLTRATLDGIRRLGYLIEVQQEETTV